MQLTTQSAHPIGDPNVLPLGRAVDRHNKEFASEVEPDSKWMTTTLGCGSQGQANGEVCRMRDRFGQITSSVVLHRKDHTGAIAQISEGGGESCSVEDGGEGPVRQVAQLGEC